MLKYLATFYQIGIPFYFLPNSEYSVESPPNASTSAVEKTIWEIFTVGPTKLERVALLKENHYKKKN